MHNYAVTIRWTGERDVGTRTYESYGRDHVIQVAGKPDLLGSSEPTYRGDASRHNPEELFVAALSSCHMLWFLHLASRQGIVVRGYVDGAVGTLTLERDGSGRFERVRLRPRLLLEAPAEPEAIAAIHEEAHAKCFIAQSVNCDIVIEATDVQIAAKS